MTQMLSQDIVQECRQLLLRMKQDLLNRARVIRSEFIMNDKNSGDEADQTVAQLAENHYLTTQERMRAQLVEVESALGRIENGNFGICEETDEMIERDRLLAIPYTRLSIEGAEIREAVKRKYVR